MYLSLCLDNNSQLHCNSPEANHMDSLSLSFLVSNPFSPCHSPWYYVEWGSTDLFSSESHITNAVRNEDKVELQKNAHFCLRVKVIFHSLYVYKISDMESFTPFLPIFIVRNIHVECCRDLCFKLRI